MTLTRREFGSMAALGLAAQFAPTLTAQSSNRKIGYAIIGLGRIADHFMRGILLTNNSAVTGLVSGHRDKANRIAAQYNVPQDSIYNYENFDEIVKNPAIDAVYVALPNSMHAEYTIRAAKAGKHVLCEKPMCVNVTEAEQMIAACKAANVKLMIAYRCQYEPIHLKAMKLIRDGQLGKIQVIEAAFGFNEVAGEWRLDKKLAGGGPLFDVGIYCLNASRYLTGEEPTDLNGYVTVVDHDGRFTSVEENVAWTMKFPSGAVSSCSTTYGAPMDGYFRVHGSKGVLECDPAFNYDHLRLRGFYSGTRLDDSETTPDPYQFQAEADHFSNCILTNQQPKTPGEEGLRDMKYITQIYTSAGIKL
jgi:predicted dehydrogenase